MKSFSNSQVMNALSTFLFNYFQWKNSWKVNKSLKKKLQRVKNYLPVNDRQRNALALSKAANCNRTSSSVHVTFRIIQTRNSPSTTLLSARFNSRRDWRRNICCNFTKMFVFIRRVNKEEQKAIRRENYKNKFRMIKICENLRCVCIDTRKHFALLFLPSALCSFDNILRISYIEWCNYLSCNF